MAGGDQKTATEAGLNNRAKDAFVKTIADQLFLIHGFIIKCIGKMRHGAEWEGFTLRPPTNYDLRTDADHLAEISAAMEKGLPPSVINAMVLEYVDSRYAGDPNALRLFTILFKADRLQGMSAELIQAEAAAKRVQPWEVYLHFAGLMLVEKIATEQNIEAMEDEAIVELLKQEAKANAGQTSTPQPSPLMALATAVAA